MDCEVILFKIAFYGTTVWCLYSDITGVSYLGRIDMILKLSSQIQARGFRLCRGHTVVRLVFCESLYYANQGARCMV